MYAKLKKLAPLLLALAAAGLTGCSTATNIPIQQVRIPPRTTVTQLELKTGEPVIFDSAGGRYVQQNDAVVGTTQDGSRLAIRLKEVDRVFFTIGNDTTGHSEQAAHFKRRQRGPHRDGITGNIRAVWTRNGWIEFDRHHGRIDSLKHTVVGTRKDGERVAVPLREISTLRIERPNDATGIVAVVAMVTVMYGLIFWSVGGGG